MPPLLQATFLVVTNNQTIIAIAYVQTSPLDTGQLQYIAVVLVFEPLYMKYIVLFAHSICRFFSNIQFHNACASATDARGR